MERISKEMLEFMRQQNPKGTRIRLYSMTDDPQPIEGGSLGTLQFIDDLGTFHVKWDNGRTLGLVVGKDSFSTLPPQLHELKLYMKLTGDHFSRDEWGNLYDEPDSIDGEELARYQGDIQKRMDHYRDGDPERGLMEYYDEPGELGDKVQKAEFDVEFRDGQLWGIVKCQVLGNLTPLEKEALIDYIAGQASDGWGEGFEQQDIHIFGGDILNVHLWNSDDWTIMTEEERFGHQRQSLPEVCWSTLPSDGSLILITRGEMGYRPCPGSSQNREANRRSAHYHNRRRGITHAQEGAMFLGSLVGWDAPGVDPKSFERHKGPEMGGMKLE